MKEHVRGFAEICGGLKRCKRTFEEFSEECPAYPCFIASSCSSQMEAVSILTIKSLILHVCRRICVLSSGFWVALPPAL